MMKKVARSCNEEITRAILSGKMASKHELVQRFWISFDLNNQEHHCFASNGDDESNDELQRGNHASVR